MITFTYSHFMRPWRVTDYLISQIFFVSMQRLSQFFSQSVNQSLSCALFEAFFSIVYATDEIRTNIDFSILTVTFSASAYEVFFTRSYRSHVDWFEFKFEVLHFKIHFIVVGVGVLWDWRFLFFVCCCFGGFFVGIKRVKDHWLFQIIQHHYISSLITWERWDIYW